MCIRDSINAEYGVTMQGMLLRASRLSNPHPHRSAFSRLLPTLRVRDCHSDTTGKELVYTGPFHRMLQGVKMVSVFSCATTAISIPILGALNTSISLQGRVTIATTCIAFAFSSTGLVHWVGGPYVAKIWRCKHHPPSIQVQTLSLLAQPKLAKIPLTEIQAPAGVNPFVSFGSAAGNNYYIHSDSSLFGDNLELYQQLNLSGSRQPEPPNKTAGSTEVSATKEP
eukprot:TRINITY_DN54974_c0_g1_i1.p1 TRINITY_DN54974_c0_g1~~TRINITY_DN54974_c0_g1_i1.p1  ORF type:complete len:225 (+),score=50.22 TRINITY_DN54974_c0_g1_i1:139-813(+)